MRHRSRRSVALIRPISCRRVNADGTGGLTALDVREVEGEFTDASDACTDACSL